MHTFSILTCPHGAVRQERSYGGYTGDLDLSFCCEMVGGQCDGQGGEGGVESSGGGGDGVGVCGRGSDLQIRY